MHRFNMMGIKVTPAYYRSRNKEAGASRWKSEFQSTRMLLVLASPYSSLVQAACQAYILVPVRPELARVPSNPIQLTIIETYKFEELAGFRVSTGARIQRCFLSCLHLLLIIIFSSFWLVCLGSRRLRTTGAVLNRIESNQIKSNRFEPIGAAAFASSRLLPRS